MVLNYNLRHLIYKYYVEAKLELEKKKEYDRRIAICDKFRHSDIEVVHRISDMLYRAIIKKGEYEVNEEGQILLPDGCYSAGFAYRVGNVDWSTLEWKDIKKN